MAKPNRKTDMRAAVAVVESVSMAEPTAVVKREILADLCKILGQRVAGGRGNVTRAARVGPDVRQLPPRLRQTLDLLLVGDSEKQIAGKLGISRHTVHVYVKALYKIHEVASRGELLARFVQLPPAASPG